VAETLVAAEIELVVMAGFGTILAEPVHEAFTGFSIRIRPCCLHFLAGMVFGTRWPMGSRSRGAPCMWPPLRSMRGRYSPKRR
jgi:folate-dependent phosphoribosylglycinamide formyltransferase PurN